MGSRAAADYEQAIQTTLGATAVALDFTTKQHRTISLGQVETALEAGQFVWIDLDLQTASLDALPSLPGSDRALWTENLLGDPLPRCIRYDRCLHQVLSGCRRGADGLQLERCDALLAPNWLLTLHSGPVRFLETVRHEYVQDFLEHARTPSFLVYEIWDHLIHNLLHVQQQLESEVEQLRTQLLAGREEPAFDAVAELTADLLRFRKLLVPSRAMLAELATRRSSLISEATQPYLQNMLSMLEGMLQDVLADRDVLTEGLNLHLSITAHRTNETVRRLTSVSILFLPLTFLCGVYGMNFRVFPELEWRLGYLYFWITALAITAVQVWLLRRAKLL